MAPTVNLMSHEQLMYVCIITASESVVWTQDRKLYANQIVAKTGIEEERLRYPAENKVKEDGQSLVCFWHSAGTSNDNSNSNGNGNVITRDQRLLTASYYGAKSIAMDE